MPYLPITISRPCVASFLIWLAAKGLRAQTIREYLSMLASTFQPQLKDSWGADKRLTFLTRSFSRTLPTTPSSTPKWNVNVVLRYLQDEHFSPLRTLEFPVLARRTAFLLLLASAARVSEASAWAAKVDLLPGHSAKLYTIAGCLPKNTSRTRLHRPSPPLTIPALDDFVTDPQELMLCPVKNLGIFLEKSASRRGDIPTLFFPYTKHSKMSPACFARWISKTIVEAYHWAQMENVLPDRPTAHELRAIASSYAAFRQVSLDHIFSLCQWHSSSVFTSKYLRDMHDLSFIASVPVVSAGVALAALHK